MNPYMAYEAVDTKIITKKSRLLDEKKLDNILECETVGQITEFLRSRYALKQIIDNIKSQDLHRDDLETILNRYAVLEIEDILHYFSGPYKDFLQTFLMRYEIHDLIIVLRKLLKGEDMREIGDRFIHSEIYSSVNYAKLAASKNILQFVESLKDTPYYNPLKTIPLIENIKREFFAEMELQALFYKTLFNKSKKLDLSDQQAVSDIVGLKIDLLNVQWIYRAKKYYEVSPEQMLIYSLPGGEKLGYGRLKKLCYSKSPDEIMQMSDKYLRCKIFESGTDIEIAKNIENCIFEHIRKARGKRSVGTAIAYIYLLEIIIRDLTAITEGIRYKLPKDQLKKYLVFSK